MMIKKDNKERNNTILILINKGMSYRRIGKLFGISHTLVKDINKKFNSLLISGNKICSLCGLSGEMIDNNHITICKQCQKMIKSY